MNLDFLSKPRSEVRHGTNYQTTISGLHRSKIYSEIKGDRFFYLKRFIDGYFPKTYYVEFYEIYLIEKEVAMINDGLIRPLRKNKKKSMVQSIEDFKLHFVLYVKDPS